MKPSGTSGGSYVTPSNTGAEGKSSTEARLGSVEDLTRAVLLVVVLSLVAIVISGIAIVIDQLHFNNEVYRDSEYNHTKTILQTDYTPTPAAFSNPLAITK